MNQKIIAEIFHYVDLKNWRSHRKRNCSNLWSNNQAIKGETWIFRSTTSCRRPIRRVRRIIATQMVSGIPNALWSFQRRSFHWDCNSSTESTSKSFKNIVDAEEMYYEAGGDADLKNAKARATRRRKLVQRVASWKTEDLLPKDPNDDK